MSKTIKIIDLLNKIANGEKVPKKIKFEEEIYKYNERMEDYKDEGNYYLFDKIANDSVKKFLINTVEIIEEQEEIDIPNIGMMDLEKYGFDNKDEFAIDLIFKVNELVQAVKQLDLKIKEIK